MTRSLFTLHVSNRSSQTREVVTASNQTQPIANTCLTKSRADSFVQINTESQKTFLWYIVNITEYSADSWAPKLQCQRIFWRMQFSSYSKLVEIGNNIQFSLATSYWKSYENLTSCILFNRKATYQQGIDTKWPDYNMHKIRHKQIMLEKNYFCRRPRSVQYKH